MHLGWGNFNSGVLTVMTLVPFSLTVFGEGLVHLQMHMDTDKEALTFWDALDGIDLDKDYDAEIWQISQQNTPLFDFIPGVVLLERPGASTDDASFKVWRANPPKLLPLPPSKKKAKVEPTPIEDWTINCPVGVGDDPGVGERLEVASHTLRLIRRLRHKAAKQPKLDSKKDGVLRPRDFFQKHQVRHRVPIVVVAGTAGGTIKVTMPEKILALPLAKRSMLNRSLSRMMIRTRTTTRSRMTHRKPLNGTRWQRPKASLFSIHIPSQSDVTAPGMAAESIECRPSHLLGIS